MAIKKATPIKSQKALELMYRRKLNSFAKNVISAVREELLTYLKNHQESYQADSLSDDISKIFNQLNARFTGVLTQTFSESIANEVVTSINKTNKRKFDQSVAKATGVDLTNIIETEGLTDFVSLNIQKNVSLIKSLPEEYLKQVEVIVNNGLVSGRRYSEISKEIMSKTGATAKLANRIKTIARNEVQTINAQLTLRRSQALGIKKGIYRTSEDERVRKCHKELNGVEFDLTKGAWSKTCQKYIIPGVTDINCRCTYSPVIEVA